MPQYALRHALPLLRAPDALTVRCQKTRSLMTTPDFTLEYCAAKQQPHTIPLGAVFTFKGSGETFVCLPCGVTCEDCAFDSTNKRGKKHAAAVKGCRSFACVPSMRLDGQRTKAVTMSKHRQDLPF